MQRCVCIYVLRITHTYTHAGEIRGLEFMGNVPVEVRPIIGAALCGVVASKYPEVLFFGYDTVNSLLAETFPYMGDTSMFSTHCNALQHTATHCNTLQRTATHCNALQRTATHCNALQRTVTHCNALQRTATYCNALQRTATHCNALQRTAPHCNTLQHTLPYCTTLQHT